jgi:large repetitive protein
MRTGTLWGSFARGTHLSLLWKFLIGLWLYCAGSALLPAEVLPGNNPAGSYTDFLIVVPPDATNLSLTVAGTSSSWSYLIVTKGDVPSTDEYDWSSQLDRTTNALYLEGPEVAAGDHLLVRVKTPTSSGAHSFTLYTEPNRTDLRTANKPMTKSLSSFAKGLVPPGTNDYYRLEMVKASPTSIALDGQGGPAPDLYWSLNTVPTTSSYIRKSTGSTNNLIALALSETSPGVYYIGVFGTSALAGGEPYKLTLAQIKTVDLSWDPGDTHVGSTAFTNTTVTATDYYYHIVTANPAAGAWRTALRVLSGEADLYMGRGILPTPSLNTAASVRPGSDGILLASGSTGPGYFQPGEEWYILVRAKAGATWSLVTGTPYVQALGAVASDDSSSSGQVEVGPEGMRFFRADITTDTLAWRLWLKGQTNGIWLKRATVPLTGNSLWEYMQSGQMLVVPPYLSAGSYYIGVNGTPGSTITLDSRQQPVVDLPYGNSVTCSATGFAYVTYRVQVPADQIAWQLYVPTNSGNPSLAVRRNTVPSENFSDAVSDLPGNTAENLSIVPPMLGNGTFYVTLYNTNIGANTTFTGTLQSGPPLITDIQYHSSTLNTDTNRVGWRFFRLPNSADQMSGLGWDLWVSNAVLGTQVAVRRGNVPSFWSSRSLSMGMTVPSALPVNNYDTLSTGSFIQDPAHEPDTWYIGVYNPTNALGPFTLISGDLIPTALADNVPVPRTNSLPGRWDFYSVTLTAADLAGANAALGWDLRLVNVTSGVPKLVVCKDKLPISMNTTLSPTAGTDWPSGAQWAPGQDWLQRSYSPAGTNEDGRILACAVGRPMGPGNYYIGVMSSGGTNSYSYSVLSRWIGVGRSIPVTDLDYATGRATNTVAVREAAYYRVNVPVGSDSWKWHIKAGTNGETMAVVTPGFIPNMNMEKRVEKPADEWYVRLPAQGQTSIAGGSYFIAVVGEGDGLVPSSSKVGTGPSTFTLESLGLMPRVDLGTLDQDDIYYTNQLLSAGETTGYQVHVAPRCWGYWALLEQPTGYPWVVLYNNATSFPDPGYVALAASDLYGNEGGATAPVASSPLGITIAAPSEGQNLVVKARLQGTNWSNASYVLHIKPAHISLLDFDGGTATVTNSAPLFGDFFYVDVPTNAIGWDLRLTNVTAGSPRLVIGKDNIPLNANTWPPGMDPYALQTWSYGAWLTGALDCSGKPLDADGTDESSRIWMDGINRPLLIPGRYYVQVVSQTVAANYTIVSRGIGNLFSLPAPTLAFAGGQMTISNLAPREAAYFKVTVPTNTTSWKVQVSGLSGDSTLCVLKGTPPNIAASATTSSVNQEGRKMQRLGDEYYLLLPTSGSDYIGAGDYFLSVTSEGMGSTAANRLGTNSSAFTVTSIGPAPVTDLGLIGPNSMDVTSTNVLGAGDTEVYRFTIATNTLMATVNLSPVTGTPTLALLNSTRIPDPSGYIIPYGSDPYGNEGGEINGVSLSTNSFSLPNPTPGTYMLVVKARGTNAANYVLHATVTAVPINDLGFDPGVGGNVFPVSGQVPQTWTYWAVNVPTNAQGWDVRISSVSGGSPKLVVKRGSVPTSTYTTPWGSPGTYNNWPTNSQWAPTGDWTKRTYAPDGATSEDGRILAMGMYRPLEPGLYYVGVFNSAPVAPTNATSYTLTSRGIGPGMAIAIVDLPTGASLTNLSLPPREAAYYRVVVDSNTPSLKLSLNILTNIGGECMLTALRGALPNVSTISGGSLLYGRTMQKPGDEHLALLPTPGQTNLVASTNYFAVVGEGMNPPGITAVGRGSSAYTLTSEGAVPVTDLGVVTSEDIVQPDKVPSGDIKAYRFQVYPGTYGVQLRLENRSGNPTVAVVQGDQLPDPGAASATGSGGSLSSDSYGNEGGFSPIDSQPNILTIANPAAGDYTVVVKARPNGTTYPDAEYTLRVVEVLAPELNFTQEMNSNGLPNTFSAVIQDNERAFFRIEVPATNSNGEPIIGWQLTLSQTVGLAQMRASKGVLPSDTAYNQMNWATASAILAPPYLTNGVWFVEVKGSGTTAFTLTSSALTLTRPAWNLPRPGQTTNTAGLTLPFFGDTGIDTNGVALQDPMTILQQGEWHYYAVQVPDGNIGLMRAELQAGSGNPDLYLRQGAVPTLYHTTAGGSGQIVDRSMANLLDTEYANWVPLDGKTESQLKPGLWYMAVKASGGASARYRLRLSVGSVTDLSLDGTMLTNQTVLGGDWCYYRFTPPTGIPLNLVLNFGRDYGDVLVQLRSEIPPGNGITGQTTDIRDWGTDRKNGVTYTTYTQPGSYLLTAPPVRPGEALYLGLRATSRSTFSIGVSNATPYSPDPPLIAFYGGTAQAIVPAHNSVLYRIDVPAAATRWKHSATHTTNLVLYLDQGTPATTTNSINRSSQPNSSLNMPLVLWNTTLRTNTPATWPWVAGRSYYLQVVNSGNLDEAFSIIMDGRNSETDDNDSNGLPDAWEMYYFGRTGNVGSTDSDGDGVSNLTECMEKTDPTNARDFRPRLYVMGLNGTVAKSPDQLSYPMGSTVTLIPSPNAGYAFVGWSGDATGSTNPLPLWMNGHKTVTANFKRAGDDFSTALPLSGTNLSVASSNLGFTKEPGEPYHAGNYGGKSIWWNWTAPKDGLVSLSTAGSTFTTLLAVYTGNAVNALTPIASDGNPLSGTNRSHVSFPAKAGMTYRIVVDGYNGASASIQLSLTMPTATVVPVLSQLSRDSNGTVSFNVRGAANHSYTVEYSSDLAHWTACPPLTTDTNGNASFSDNTAAAVSARFYRVKDLSN